MKITDNIFNYSRQYLMAGSVIVTLPVLFIFVYFEKYLVSGLTAGSVKG